MYYSEQMTTRVKQVTEQVEEVKGVLVQNLGNIPSSPPTSKSSITLPHKHKLLLPSLLQKPSLTVSLHIEKVLKRGENLEMVEFNANQMAEKGGQFKKVSKKLKKKKFWGLIKWKCFCLIALGILVVVVVYLIGALVCGGWR